MSANKLAQRVLQHERQMRDHAKDARKKLLHKCRILHSQFQECNINLLTEDKGDFTLESFFVADALDLLSTSDDRVALLLSEVPLLSFNHFLDPSCSWVLFLLCLNSLVYALSDPFSRALGLSFISLSNIFAVDIVGIILGCIMDWN